MRTAIALLTLLALAGCSQTNLSEILSAVGQSDRSWCLKHTLTTIYGQTRTDVMGSGGENVTVKCSDDGLTVTRTAPPSKP